MLLDDRLIAGARQYLFDQPPKRQVWVEGSVQWDEMTGFDVTAPAPAHDEGHREGGLEARATSNEAWRPRNG